MNLNILIALLLLVLWLQQPAYSANNKTPLNQVELINKNQSKQLQTLVNAPRVVFYFLKHASSASCGLMLSTTNSTQITPILETEAGENYPFCDAANEGAAFKFHQANFWVF
jgi:hypothetical protein